MRPIAIDTHYDTAGIITAESCAATEFARWQEFATEDPEWVGNEFCEREFVDYIEKLQESV